MSTAHFSQDFQRLFLWSLRFLARPPLLLMAGVSIVSLVLSFVRQQPFRTGLWRRSSWLIFTQLLFFPVIVAVGALFPAMSQPDYKANVTGERLLDGLLYLSLATSAFWLWRMKGLRWLAASLLVLLDLILIAAGLIAGMSVSGDWP